MKLFIVVNKVINKKKKMETAAVGCSLEHNYKFSEEMGRSFVLILHMHIVY